MKRTLASLWQKPYRLILKLDAIFPRKVEILTGEIADIRGKGIMGKSNCLLVTIVTSNHSSSLIHLNV